MTRVTTVRTSRMVRTWRRWTWPLGGWRRLNSSSPCNKEDTVKSKQTTTKSKLFLSRATSAVQFLHTMLKYRSREPLNILLQINATQETRNKGELNTFCWQVEEGKSQQSKEETANLFSVASDTLWFSRLPHVSHQSCTVFLWPCLSPISHRTH